LMVFRRIISEISLRITSATFSERLPSDIASFALDDFQALTGE
jgi:hypothetical protein